MLDVSAFTSACRQLQTSLAYLSSDAALADPELRKQFRGASILAFEFTHELASKMLLRRHVATLLPNPAEAAGLSHMDLLRAASSAGLPLDPTAWRRYRELRNPTSHTYDGERAEELVAMLPDFLVAASQLAAALRAAHG